ncbi:MAG TPA: DUF433 domain-containing protein [Thermoplasmata archaeon]|nr:DUF433 domain-containing protein [Thermoplasmata archaeon]
MAVPIVRNPRILGGKPVIAGTRISVALIRQLAAAGMTVEEIAREYEDLSITAIRAALAYRGPTGIRRRRIA